MIDVLVTLSGAGVVEAARAVVMAPRTAPYMALVVAPTGHAVGHGEQFVGMDGEAG